MRRAILVGIVLIATARASTAEPVEIFLGGSAVGRGYIYRELAACWVLTPTHVITTGGKLREFGVKRLDGSSGIALRPVDLKDDLAVAPVQGLDHAQCGSPLPGWTDLSSVIESVSNARIDTIEGRAIVRRAATIVALDGVRGTRIAVKPLNPRDAIYQGMSGSVIFAQLAADIGDRPIGMLIGVGPDGVSGIALRWDLIVRRVEAFQRTLGAAPKPASAPSQNLAAESRGTKVVRWSVAPATPAEGPQNLLRPAAVWRTSQPASVVEIEIVLPVRSQAIRSISISQGGTLPSAASPDRMSVLFLQVRDDGARGEIIGPVCTIANQGRSSCGFAEMEVAGVRLSFFRADQRPFTVALSDLQIH